jgi:hypothetical protein
LFLAGIEPDSERTEAAYSELRKRSQIVVGWAARPRRISNSTFASGRGSVGWPTLTGTGQATTK